MVKDSPAHFSAPLKTRVVARIIAPSIVTNPAEVKYVDQKLVPGRSRWSELDLVRLLALLEEVEEVRGIQLSFLGPYGSYRISLVTHLRRISNMDVRSASLNFSLSAMVRNSAAISIWLS